MKRTGKRTSGFDREHLKMMKYASAESKFDALTAMIDCAIEAQESCKKRGAPYKPLFSE